MKRLAAMLAALVVCSTPAAAVSSAPPSAVMLAPGAYVLDTERAKLTSRLRWLGVARHEVRFRRVTGEVNYDPARPDRSRLVITVDPRSMSGADGAAERQMLQMLEPERYPRITFVTRRLPEAGDTSLVGDLTLHGVTRPLVLHFTFGNVTGPASAPERVSFAGRGAIKRSEFGIAAMSGLVTDQVDLRFDVEFVRRS